MIRGSLAPTFEVLALPIAWTLRIADVLEWALGIPQRCRIDTLVVGCYVEQPCGRIGVDKHGLGLELCVACGIPYKDNIIVGAPMPLES